MSHFGCDSSHNNEGIAKPNKMAGDTEQEYH